MNHKFEVTDLSGTEALARKVAGLVKGGELILLKGPLGSGKTAFVRAFVESLGIKDPVSSPTYVLHHEYGDKIRVSHWDLYRLAAAPEEMTESRMNDEIVLVEWAERAPELEHASDLIIEFFLGSTVESRVVALGGRLASAVIS